MFFFKLYKVLLAAYMVYKSKWRIEMKDDEQLYRKHGCSSASTSLFSEEVFAWLRMFLQKNWYLFSYCCQSLSCLENEIFHLICMLSLFFAKRYKLNWNIINWSLIWIHSTFHHTTRRIQTQKYCLLMLIPNRLQSRSGMIMKRSPCSFNRSSCDSSLP